MKPLVYIAGPYTNPDPVTNTRVAALTGTRFVDDGLCTPVVPHLSMLWHTISPKPLEWWYEYDLELLAHCDAVLRLPGASTGADAEVAFARGAGIPVFDTCADLYRWLTPEVSAERKPCCDEDLGGSHYHCAECGKTSGMFGHFVKLEKKGKSVGAWAERLGIELPFEGFTCTKRRVN